MPDRPVDQRQPDEKIPRDEMAMARVWLDALRNGVVHKLDGLSEDQLRWKPAPGANSLGTLAMHLGYAERLWFRAVCAGEAMDMEWRSHMFDDPPEGWGRDEIVAFYDAEVAAANRALDGCESLDQPGKAEWRPTTWRWAVVHMTEEIARHLGHMDITRELIDGATGR